MKILYVITQADGGGAQKYTLALARHFGGTIAAGNEAGQLFTDARALGVKCIELRYLKRNINPFYDISAVWELRKMITELQPDIVHLNSSKAGVLGSFAAIGTKSKIVFTAHGFIFNEPLGFALKKFYLALEKIASGYRDCIITVSDADRESALKYKLIDSQKIITIHNGIGPAEFLPKDAARQKLNLPSEKFIFGAVANFYLTKGVDVLIDALALIDASARSNIMVVAVGDGPERKNLELRIKNYDLGNTAMLVGKVDGASKYLKAFDSFIMPSRKEGFPYAILEAMQAGLPIVATNVGGIPEALNGAGILVEPENPQDLARAMELLHSDVAKQKELSQKSYEKSKLFTEEKMLAETENVYKNILK